MCICITKEGYSGPLFGVHRWLDRRRRWRQRRRYWLIFNNAPSISIGIARTRESRRTKSLCFPFLIPSCWKTSGTKRKWCACVCIYISIHLLSRQILTGARVLSHPKSLLNLCRQSVCVGWRPSFLISNLYIYIFLLCIGWWLVTRPCWGAY